VPGLGEDLGHRVHRAQPVDLVVNNLEHRHGGKDVHHAPVLLGKVENRIAAHRPLYTGFPASQDQARSKAFNVVLKRSTHGFVEVVDVEDQAAIGRCIRPEVQYMGVTAELRRDASIWMAGEVRSHNRDRPAKEAERTGGHPLILYRDKTGHTPNHGLAQQLERLMFAGRGQKVGVRTPRELLARAEAQGLAIGVG
jgi:hypothetical protein